MDNRIQWYYLDVPAMLSSFLLNVCNHCDVLLSGKIVDFEDVSEVITASVLKVKIVFL